MSFQTHNKTLFIFKTQIKGVIYDVAQKNIILKWADYTKLIILRSEVCSDWPAIQCVVIGRIPQAWDGNVTPLTYCDAVSRRDDTQKQ